jgi:hypothetical protein
LDVVVRSSPIHGVPLADQQLISHNHYDHCDLPTLKDIYTKHTDRPPYLFIPLANSHTLKGTVPSDRVIEMDWWDERIIEVEGKGKARVTCSELLIYVFESILKDSTMSALLRKNAIRQESCSLVVMDYTRIGRGWKDQGICKSVVDISV